MQQPRTTSTHNPSRDASAIDVVNTSTICDRDSVQQLGYEMGVLSATYWASVKDSRRFRYMTIVDYRDSGAAESAKSLTDAAQSSDFINGFLMGFEDEAFERAEAGMVGFEDVLAAGSVDGSVSVTARRLLKLVIGAGITLN